MGNPVEQDRTFPIQNVIQFGRALVIMLARPVDVYGVGPGGHVGVLPADEQVPPPTRAALARRLSFVAN
jgi:hypothetical protein